MHPQSGIARLPGTPYKSAQRRSVRHTTDVLLIPGHLSGGRVLGLRALRDLRFTGGISLSSRKDSNRDRLARREVDALVKR